LGQNVAKFGADTSKLDEVGCLREHNQAAKAFNLHLQAFCSKLQGQYQDVNVTYVDIFTIKSNLIANYSKHGKSNLQNFIIASSKFSLNLYDYSFAGFEQPIMACCRCGGPPLNFDSRVSCGLTTILSNGTTIKAKGCNDSSVYVNWDGTHYTEAANQYVASQILTGNYSKTCQS
jgi:phospholipase/lecithinase/hemolysin